MKKYKIYAAGRFIETQSPVKIKRPYDGEAFAETYLADPGVLDDCIVRGLAAKGEMRDMPVHERSRALAAVADGMAQARNVLAEVLCQEAGKPLKFALGEVDRAIQTFRIASEECKRIPGEYIRLDWTPAGAGKEGWLRYYPSGLVGAIAPFNFPLNLSVHKIAPALAGGNCIILKPASQTPITVLELAEIIDRAGFPQGAVSILPMARDTGTRLASDPRIQVVTFTGSPEVGWKLREIASKKKVILELGGNAGVMIAESANLDSAVKKCVAGGFAYSGQVCIHVQRIFVIRRHFEWFCNEFVRLTRKLKRGNPLDPATDISCMIDEDNALRVESWIRESVEGGAQILTGGSRDGCFVEPTVLTGTGHQMKVCRNEVFGPVVSIEPVDSFDEGIRFVNDSRFGLQAGVFTNNLAEMDQAARELEVGGVIINDVPTFRVDHMPYGGVKDSGMGREGVRYAMIEMMESRLLVKNL